MGQIEPKHQNQIKIASIQKKKVAPEAVAFQSDAVEIELTKLPKAARTAIYMLVLMILLAILGAWYTEVDRVVTVQGKLVSQSRNITVQSIRQATLKDIRIKAGDRVEKNQLLASLDPTDTKADKDQLVSQIMVLEVKLARLKSESSSSNFIVKSKLKSANLEKAIFERRQAEYENNLRAYHQKNQSILISKQINNKQILQINAELELAQIKNKHNKSLNEKKFLSNIKLLEAKHLVIRLSAALKEKNLEFKKLEYDEQVLLTEKKAFIANWFQKIETERFELSNKKQLLEIELKKANNNAKLDNLIASENSIVLEVTTKSIGSVINSSETLITLVPINKDLEIEVNINPRDIGWLETGQNVRVKLEPFPFQRHGTIEGKLVKISPDAIPVQQNGTSLHAYRGVISIDEMKLRNLPNNFALLPGISVLGEVKIGKRTILSYIIAPFVKSLDESLKEP